MFLVSWHSHDPKNRYNKNKANSKILGDKDNNFFIFNLSIHWFYRFESKRVRMRLKATIIENTGNMIPGTLSIIVG